MIPSGRGFYVWQLPHCDGGDVSRIIDRCKRCGVTWLAVKAGDQGRPWAQFTASLVDQLHAAGIKVFGWSYDVPDAYRAVKDNHVVVDPSRVRRQVEVIRSVLAAGADGFVTDSEVEWDRGVNPDREAHEYADAMVAAVPPDFTLGDAPWPIIACHPTFPFTVFGQHVQFRCPQVYWTEIGGGVGSVWARYTASWDRFAAQGHPVRPMLPSGSVYHKVSRDEQGRVHMIRACTVADVATFERLAREAGCPGVLHWEYSQVPSEVWAAMESGAIPAWG